MNRATSFPLYALLAAGLLAGCGGDEPDANAEGAAGEPIKVGAVFDLTGATADVGQPYAEGVRGYVDWVNSNGGIEGRPIDLMYQDYAYQVPQAEQLYSRFVKNEGAVAFIGWGTGDTEALRSKIAQDRVPFMSGSLSESLGDPKQAPYNFLPGASYSDQFRASLDWIKKDWASRGGSGAPKVALMHHPSPFGLSPWTQGGQEYARKIGVDAEAYEMPKGATDYTAELSRIRQSGAEYVVFQTVSSPAALALKNASDLGMKDVTFVCLNWCSDENVLNLAGPAAEGLVGAMPFAPPSANAAGFADMRSHLQSKGSTLEKEGSHYAQGWATMALMTEGIRRVVASGQEVTGENIKAALEELKDHDTGGVTAPVTFGTDEHLGTDAVWMYRVQNGTWQPLGTGYVSPEAKG